MHEREEIMGIVINYDAYVKRDMERYLMWIPFSYEIAASCFRFLNDNFFFERDKPELSIYIGYDYASHNRAIELSVRIKETGYGEAELFTMDIFDRSYSDVHGCANFVKSFMERFQKNILRSAVMEKIDLYRHPPKPIVDWFPIKMGGLMLANTAIRLAIAFCVVTVFVIYMCLS